MLTGSNSTLNNKKYLAGISGGPDSMLLLDKYKDQIAIVCHINYHKRLESDIDQNVVSKYCLDNNLKLEILDVNEKLLKDYSINNFQHLARQIRYDFFYKIAQKYQLNTVLIAHNWNDFLETAYLQMAKKSLSPFYGIKPISQYKNLIILRPLIHLPKKLIIDTCNHEKIPYIIDKSNLEDCYERNHIRKIIDGYSLRELNDFFNDVVSYNKKNNSKINSINSAYQHWKGINFNLDFFNKQPKEIQIHLIYQLLDNLNLNNRSRNKLELISNFLKSKLNNKSLRIGHTCYLKKTNREVQIINRHKNKNI